MQVYRCSWSLGVPTKQLQRWGLPLLTQPCARHRGHSPRLGTCEQLHTTRVGPMKRLGCLDRASVVLKQFLNNQCCCCLSPTTSPTALHGSAMVYQFAAVTLVHASSGYWHRLGSVRTAPGCKHTAVRCVIYPPLMSNSFLYHPCMLCASPTGRPAAANATAAAKPQPTAALLAGPAQGSPDSSLEWPVLPDA